MLELFRQQFRQAYLRSGLSSFKKLGQKLDVSPRLLSALLSTEDDPNSQLHLSQLEAINQFIEENGGRFVARSSLFELLASTDKMYLLGSFMDREQKVQRASHFDVDAMMSIQSAIASHGGVGNYTVSYSNDFESKSETKIIIASPRAHQASEFSLCKSFHVPRYKSPLNREEMTLPFYFYWPDDDRRSNQRSSFQLQKGLLPKDVNPNKPAFAFRESNDSSLGWREVHRLSNPGRNATWKTYGCVVCHFHEGSISLTIAGATAPGTAGTAAILPSLVMFGGLGEMKPFSSHWTAWVVVEVDVTANSKAADPRVVTGQRVIGTDVFYE